MRPQTLGLIAASTLTGLFLVALGAVAVWQLLPPPLEQPQQQPPFMVQFGGPAQPPAVLDFPFEPVNAQPLAPVELAKVRGDLVAANAYNLSGPHAHGNLTVFLIHGQDKLRGQKIMTLQEGLAQGTVVVTDTRTGTLTINNRGNAALFIQGGDIVKGGTQDRTLPFDMLISAHSQNVPIPALCVEAGRSGPRAGEASASFGSSSEQLPGSKLRMAAYSQNQGQVWSNVQAMQGKLAKNAGGSVNGQQSPTSLQLSLEHPRVQAAVQEYLAALSPALDDKNDVIGYAVVINGKVQSADVYASADLFQKLWPKLLKASAVEALSERRAGAAAAPAIETVQAFLQDAEQGQAFRVQGADGSVIIRQETAQTLLHDTCDPARQNLVLHRSFLAK